MANRHDIYKMTMAEELEYTKTQLKEKILELKAANKNSLELKERALKAEQLLEPIKKSLSKLTAEKSKWERKQARLNNSC